MPPSKFKAPLIGRSSLSSGSSQDSVSQDSSPQDVEEVARSQQNKTSQNNATNTGSVLASLENKENYAEPTADKENETPRLQNTERANTTNNQFKAVKRSSEQPQGGNSSSKRPKTTNSIAKPTVSLSDEEYERIFSAVIYGPIEAPEVKTESELNASTVDLFEASQSDIEDLEKEDEEGPPLGGTTLFNQMLKEEDNVLSTPTEVGSQRNPLQTAHASGDATSVSCESPMIAYLCHPSQPVPQGDQQNEPIHSTPVEGQQLSTPQCSQQGETLPATPQGSQQGESLHQTSSEGQQRELLPATPQNSQQRESLPATLQGSQQRESLPPTPQGSQQRESLPPTPQGSQQRESLPPTPQGSQQRGSLPPTPQGSQQRGSLPPTPQSSQQQSGSEHVQAASEHQRLPLQSDPVPLVPKPSGAERAGSSSKSKHHKTSNSQHPSQSREDKLPKVTPGKAVPARKHTAPQKTSSKSKSSTPQTPKQQRNAIPNPKVATPDQSVPRRVSVTSNPTSSPSSPRLPASQGQGTLPGSQQLTQELVLSQPPSQLTARERLLWLQEKRVADGLWAQCDEPACGKWRYLSDCHDPCSLPDKWCCSLNPDEEYNSCDVPEKRLSLRDEEDMIFNKFSPGSVVWAKVEGHRWWPAMVEDDPDLEMFFWVDALSDIPTWYHVTFLEDKHVSRAWVQSERLKPFRLSDSSMDEDEAESRKLALARDMARNALELDVLQRLKKFSFAATFTGRIGELKSSTKYRGYVGFREKI